MARTRKREREGVSEEGAKQSETERVKGDKGEAQGHLDKEGGRENKSVGEGKNDRERERKRERERERDGRNEERHNK